jgi:hypothetical protein
MCALELVGSYVKRERLKKRGKNIFPLFLFRPFHIRRGMTVPPKAGRQKGETKFPPMEINSAVGGINW